MSGQEQGKKRKRPRLTSEFLSIFPRLGFETLTEIQKTAIPIIFQGRTSLVMAPTGSGKTECSVLPIFYHAKRSRIPGRIRVLYVTPLRALNRDVFRRITRYAEFHGLEIAIRHGDTTQTARRRIAENPPDVLITTPETLVVLLTQPKMLAALSRLSWVVIDELHELLPSERGSQLAASLERLELNTTENLVRIGLSATMGDPKEASRFLAGARRGCAILQDSSVREYDVEVRRVEGTISDAADEIAASVSSMRLDSPVLLFANTRGEAEFLASALRERSSLRIDLHHGSLSRQVREEAEESLKKGVPGIVVCTSSLELGLDIGSVEVVIHYGSPRQVSKLVQRIGRSRHRRDSSARGLVITNNLDDELEASAILSRTRTGSIEEQRIHDAPLDVLAHHLVGLSLQAGRVKITDAHRLFSRAYPFRNLGIDEVESTIEMLDSNYLVHYNRDDASYFKKRDSFRYYFENLSTIPDILKFRVFDTAGNRIIGTLDQRFVGDFGEAGNVFVLRGMQWRILNVDEKSLAVNVVPHRAAKIQVPYWEGENIPVDRATAQRAARFRTMARTPSGSDIRGMPGRIPDEKTLVAESVRREGIIVLHSCLGTRINSTLSVLLSAMLSARLGFVVESRSDAYRIALSSNSRITEEMLRDVLEDSYDLEDIVSVSLAGTHNLDWKTWCVAKKFGVVRRGAVYEKKSARFLYERYARTPLGAEALRELLHDKYDITGTKEALCAIMEKKTSLVWLDADGFSPLAEPILDHTTRYYSSPASIEKGILEMIKERIAKTRHRLICVRCGRWEMMYETRDIPALRCPRCRTRQITATFHSDYELSGIIRKKCAGERITADERRRYERAWKVASLVENFGMQAITVISGHGVGADTAARILRNMTDEEALYRQIYEAERQYVMTRGFWD